MPILASEVAIVLRISVFIPGAFSFRSTGPDPAKSRTPGTGPSAAAGKVSVPARVTPSLVNETSLSTVPSAAGAAASATVTPLGNVCALYAVTPCAGLITAATLFLYAIRMMPRSARWTS